MPTFVLSIDRSTMTPPLAPLVLSGVRNDPASNTVLGVKGYQEPAAQVRLRTAPPSDYTHGDVALGWVWQQSILGFEVMATGVDEAAARSAVRDLQAAVSRLAYLVTITVDGAPTETWTCSAGSITPVRDRSYVDLTNHQPVWSVQISCHPVPVIGA